MKATDTNYMTRAKTELRQKIEGTNNGYLFCPTAEEVYIATLFPESFSINFAPMAKEFKFRITNKSV